jgi:hypothetical protein
MTCLSNDIPNNNNPARPFSVDNRKSKMMIIICTILIITFVVIIRQFEYQHEDQKDLNYYLTQKK